MPFIYLIISIYNVACAPLIGDFHILGSVKWMKKCYILFNIWMNDEEDNCLMR